jgi:hypothetical protein
VDVLGGPVVVLSGEDCAELGRQLAEAIRLAYRVRGRQAPRHLLAFSDQVNAVVRAARGRTETQVTSSHGPVRGRERPSLPLSDQPVTLTTSEAAQLAGVHERTVRKWIQRGDVATSQDHEGAPHLVYLASLAAKISQRRKDDESKAA